MKHAVDDYIQEIFPDKNLLNMSTNELKILEGQYEEALEEMLGNPVRLQEADVDIFIAYKLAMLLLAIGLFFVQCAVIKSMSKPMPAVTKKCQELLGTKKWKVNVIPMPDEKGKQIPNAFSTGQDTVFVTKGLVSLVNEKELTAVSLHEISHSDTKDVQKNMGINIGSDVLGTILLKSLAKMGNISVAAFILIVALYYLIMHLGKMKMSRVMEFKSDSFAVKYGFGDSIISALRKMMAFYKKHYGISEDEPKSKIGKLIRYISNLFATHPPLKERAENVLKKKEFYDAVGKGPEAVKKFSKKEI